MARRTVDESSLTAVADAIRERGGTSDQMVFPDGFVSAVEPLVNAEDYLAQLSNNEVTEIVNSKITGRIWADFQRNNANLVRVDLPLATALGEAAFASCTNLVNVNFPSVTEIASNAFSRNTSQEKLHFPSLTKTVGYGYIFNVCINLRRIYFPKLVNIVGAANFYGCWRLKALILGADTVCGLANADQFHETPIVGYTNHTDGEEGYIYVPRSLLSDTDASKDYRRATNWSAFADKFRAIEDYPEVLEGWE